MSKKPLSPFPGLKENEYRLVTYSITYDALEDPVYHQLPQAIRDEVDKLYLKMKTMPVLAKQCVPRLRELVKLYPEQPKIANYLFAAYHITRNPKIDNLICENYAKHPHYLFARLNYAGLCLKRQELDKIPAIFKEGFNLKLLYPERNCFHISEVTSFDSVMFHYFLTIGNQATATVFYQDLEQIEPGHRLTLEAKRILEAYSLEPDKPKKNKPTILKA